MGEKNSESLESFFISTRNEEGLTKKIRYFEPDKNIPHWPTYSDLVYQEINDIINKEGYRPFYIDSAVKTKKEEQEFLELKGHYDTFDGLKIEISFSGKYGNPKDHIGLFGPKIKEDSFSSFTLEAKIIGADARQEKIFSSIVMRDEGLSFYNNHISLRQFESGLHKESNIALEKIRRIGKIITLYDGVHIKEKMNEIAEKIPIFMQDINNFHPTILSDIGLEIYEYQDHRDRDPLFKRMGDMMLEFNVFIRFCATDTKNNRYRIKYEYAIEHNAWRIEVYWPSLNKLRYAYRKVKNKTEETKHLMQKIDFIYASLGIRGFDPDDIVGNSYDMEFERYIHEARKEIKKTNPKYEPLVRTTGEGNVLYYNGDSFDPEQGDIVFNSKEEYQLFDLIIFKLISNKKWDIKTLLKDRTIHSNLNKNPEIKRRVMTYYGCYCQNPEKAYTLFCKKDPAYVLALEKYKSAEKNLH